MFLPVNTTYSFDTKEMFFRKILEKLIKVWLKG